MQRARPAARYTLPNSFERSMPPSQISPAESILIDLVHDLRQHLGNIETSLYCLGLLGEVAPTRSHGHLHTIELQVARAGERLAEAGAAINRLRAQRAEGAGDRQFTNPATSAAS